ANHDHKGVLPNTSNISINGDISAAENFLALNSMNGSARKIVPLISMKLPFFTFNENDLICISGTTQYLVAMVEKRIQSRNGSRISRQDIMSFDLSTVGRGQRGSTSSRDYKGYL
ncbi:hypothetical protein BGZ65_010898, partial [Modicella reniformis]